MNADYSDWLNPMLVKELRQGLSKGAFVNVFILVQVAMVLFLGIRLPYGDGATDPRIGEYLDGMLATGLSIILLFVLPLRGLAAIQEEKKIQTLELVQMTRLGSRGIVWGKWAAIVSQILLFTVSVLPYGVLRYFFGGMEIAESLASLGKLLLASMTLTAFCVWLSTMGAAVRGLSVFFALTGFQAVFVRAFGIRGVGGVSGAFDEWAQVFGAVVSTLFLLAMAASRIASIAENHAVVLRSLALIAGVVGCAGAMLGSSAWAIAGLPVIMAAMFIALTEPTSEVPSMYSPWLAWGLPGRLACRVMNPGWASGLVFCLVVVALLAVTLIATAAGPTQDLWRTLSIVAMVYVGLITPVCIFTTSFGRSHRGMLYLLTQGLCAMFAITAWLMQANSGALMGTDGFHSLVASLTPTSAAIWAMTHLSKSEQSSWQYFTTVTAPISGAILLYLTFRATGEFRLMAKQEAKAVPPRSLS